MNLDPLVGDLLALASAVALPVGLLLANRVINVVESRLHITLSEQSESTIMSAVHTGVGLLRAKLATGRMDLSDVHIGNPHVDAAVNDVIKSANFMVATSTLKQADLAQMIVSELGHVLGEDPTVASVATAPVVPIEPTKVIVSQSVPVLNDGPTISVNAPATFAPTSYVKAPI